MITTKFLILGPRDVGKTELGLRLEKIKKRSMKSTSFINTFVHAADNFFKKEEKEELFVLSKKLKLSAIDLAGELMKVEEYGLLLLDCTGLVYVFESPKPKIGLKRIGVIDDEITKEYIELKEKKPPISLYMSKSEVNNSTLPISELKKYKLIKIDEKPLTFGEILNPDEFVKDNIKNLESYQNTLSVLLKDKEPDYIIKKEDYSITNELVKTFESIEYTTLGHALKFCKKRNASLFMGDSIGRNQDIINPIVYLVRTPDKVLPKPVEVNVHSIFTISIIYPKVVEEGYVRKELESNLVEDCIKYKVINH